MSPDLTNWNFTCWDKTFFFRGELELVGTPTLLPVPITSTWAISHSVIFRSLVISKDPAPFPLHFFLSLFCLSFDAS